MCLLSLGVTLPITEHQSQVVTEELQPLAGCKSKWKVKVLEPPEEKDEDSVGRQPHNGDCLVPWNTALTHTGYQTIPEHGTEGPALYRDHQRS